MIVAVGTDLVDVARIAHMLDRDRDRFLCRILTADERRYCERRARPAEAVAARFAAKEAVMKCLRTGWTDGLAFVDIEVCRDGAGVPSLRLSRRALELASAHGITHWHVSLSHTATAAHAMVIAERR